VGAGRIISYISSKGGEHKMTMSIAQMREWLLQQYHSARGWVAKVERMSDKQVVAVYYRMIGGTR
jgi:hypothetical protein